MASSSADCVFGGVRLISSASSTLAKIGPCTKVQVRWPETGSSSMMSVPVMSVGIRSGVNWMRLNIRPKHLGHGSHQQRFRRAGQAGDQAVAADEQADADLFHHFILADDNALDLPDDLGIDFAEARNPGLQNIRFNCGLIVDMISFYFSPSRRRSLRAAASGPA